jgi:DNA-binding Lrp family transcriptional regulator
LDHLDLEILKILLANNGIPPGIPVFRKSFRSMAKDLGVDQATIRKRIKKFQEQRILKGWYLGVSPSLSGHIVVNAWFRVGSEADKGKLIERLSALRNLERMCNYLGPRVSFVLFCRRGRDPDAAIQRLAKLAGPNAELHKQGVLRLPPYSPKGTDLAIIGSLWGDPWKSYSNVAKEAGLSAKTVKRRVTRLTEDGAIYMLPIIDLKAVQGIIPVELVVDYTSSNSRTRVNERIATHLKEGLVFFDGSGPYGYFALIVPNVFQVEQIANWVKQLDGVGDVHTSILQDVVLNRSHYERWPLTGEPEPIREHSLGPLKATT